jgi:hypothetical protein
MKHSNPSLLVPIAILWCSIFLCLIGFYLAYTS